MSGKLFGGRHSALEKHREATREVGMRREVYRRRIEAGSMNAKDAARKISIMEEIAEDYMAMAETEKLL